MMPRLPWIGRLDLPPVTTNHRVIPISGTRKDGSTYHRQTKNPLLRDWEDEWAPKLKEQAIPTLPADLDVVLVLLFRFRTDTADVDGCVKSVQDLLGAQFGRDLPHARARVETTKGKPRLVLPRAWDDKSVTTIVAGKEVDRAQAGVDVLADYGQPHLAEHLWTSILERPRNPFGVPLPLAPLRNRDALRRAIGE